MFEQKGIPDTCDIHFWQTFPKHLFSAFFDGDMLKTTKEERLQKEWELEGGAEEEDSWHTLHLVSGLKFEALKLLKPSQG